VVVEEAAVSTFAEADHGAAIIWEQTAELSTLVLKQTALSRSVPADLSSEKFNDTLKTVTYKTIT
jgi:hypothetical protein